MQAPAPAPQQGSFSTSVALYVGGVGLLTAMDSMAKEIFSRLPIVEVSCLRYVFGLLAVLPVIAWVRPGWPSREAILANGARSLLSAVMAIMFFFALSTLPLAETVALSFLSPTFLALFSAWLLRERLSASIGVALAVGFLGMMVIVSGQLGASRYGPLAPLGAASAFGSAIIYACSMVMLKARAMRDAVPNIVLILNAGSGLVLAIPAYLQWHPIAIDDLFRLVAIGSLGTSGHLMLAHSFARHPASRLAPFEYSALIWAAGFGLVFFREVPSLATLGGTVLIIISTILASRR